MRKRRFAIGSLLVCGLSLFACNRLDKPVSGPDGKSELAGTGRALLHLPAIGAKYRPDSGSDTSGEFLFQLTISGPGMAPMYDSWVLRPSDAAPVLIPNIPAGEVRVFSARLIWLDPGRGDSAVTHEGADTVSIHAGATAEVMLFLHKAIANGSAHVCVAIEGISPDSACRKHPIDTVPLPQGDTGKGLEGCWKVGFQGLEGNLHLTQTGKTVAGWLLWTDGSRDTITGVFQYPYIRLFTTRFNYTNEYRGNVLPAMKHFEMKLMGTRMGVIEKMIGERTDCRVVDPPDTTGNGQDTVVDCWKVEQNLANGIRGGGRLRLTRTAAAVTGYFDWDGYPIMRISNGPVPPMASPLYLYGILPAKMAGDGKGIDYNIHYKAKISADGDSLEYGAVYRKAGSTDFTGDDAFGTWGGHRISCLDSIRIIPIYRTLPDTVIVR